MLCATMTINVYKKKFLLNFVEVIIYLGLFWFCLKLNDRSLPKTILALLVIKLRNISPSFDQIANVQSLVSLEKSPYHRMLMRTFYSGRFSSTP